MAEELDANCPVPFCLTPAIQSLISQISVVGPLQLSIVAAARCLVQPHLCLDDRQLISAAADLEHIPRMDSAWNPWL